MRGLRTAFLASAAVILIAPATTQANDFATGVITGIMGKIVVDAIVDSQTNRANTTVRNPQPRQPTAAEIARQAEIERERERTRNIQTWLTALGFEPGGIDGSIGPNTELAIRSFQASINEPQTGSLTPNQEVLLYNFAVGTPVQIEAATPSTNLPNPGVTPVVGGTTPPVVRPMVDPNLPAPAQLPGNVAMSANFSGGQTVSAQITPPPPVSVLGVRPQMQLEEARQQLVDRGYADCQDGEGLLACARGTEDVVLVGYSQNGSDTQIHTIARTVKLAAPVARATLIDELKVPYPELIGAPDLAAASSGACFEAGRPIRSAHYAPMISWIGSGAPPAADIRNFATQCLYHYSIDVAEAPEVDGFTIALFAGGPILATLTEGEVTSPLQGLSF